MQLVAQSTGLSPRLLGIVVASISSGAGELSFLQLTHWHDKLALPGFAVGTGMAGLAGAYLYLALTTWIGLSVHASLNVSSVGIFSSQINFSFFLTCWLWGIFSFCPRVSSQLETMNHFQPRMTKTLPAAQSSMLPSHLS
jgi:CLN3 protein